MSENKITIESGKEILREIRESIRKPSKKKYPYLYSYIGNDKTTLRKELFTLLDYLINSHNQKNEAGDIQQRFFTAFHQYCFYIDTDAYTEKIRKQGFGRERSNHGINLLCALGFFTKDRDPDRYGVDANMKLNTGRKRDMTIYHFRKINLKEIEDNARRLREAKITVTSISANNLRGAGLNDIADRVYFRNREIAFDKKLSEYDLVRMALEELIEEKGYCTKDELITRIPLPVKEAKKVISAFRNDIESNFRYGPPRKIDEIKFDYHYSKWIYTRRNKEDNVD